MDNCRLIRISSDYEDGTFGVLSINGQPFCLTLEPYKYGNIINHSCINPGQYVCNRIDSPKFGNTFEVLHVANRTHIAMHVGNTNEDTSGCILLGANFGDLSGKKAILNSSDTMNKFMHIMDDTAHFLLTITECF